MHGKRSGQPAGSACSHRDRSTASGRETLREKRRGSGAGFDSIIDIEDRLYRENRLYNDTHNEVIRRLNEPADQHALPYLYKQLNHMRLTGSGYTDEGQRLHQTLQTLYEEQAVWLQEQIARRPSLASFCRLMEQIDQEQMAGRDFFALAGDLRPGIRRPLPRTSLSRTGGTCTQKSEDRNRRPLHRLHTARYRRQAHDALRRHRRKNRIARPLGLVVQTLPAPEQKHDSHLRKNTAAGASS